MPDGLSREAVLAALAAVPERLALAAGASAGDPPVAGEWSVADVALHMLAVEEDVWQTRLHQMAAEDNPAWAWTEPGLGSWSGDPSLEALLTAFALRRAETLAQLHRLDEAEWRRTGTHSVFGLLDVEGLVREALRHDDEHLASLRRRAGYSP